MKISPGTLILAIFAVLFGLVGAYYAKHLMREAPVAEPQRPRPQIVPLASADLVSGRTITLGDIVLMGMTREKMRSEELPRALMSDPAQIIGRTLRQPLAEGSAFEPTAFYPEGMGPSVAERLQPGYRALTVPLENGPAELAMVSPGMMVDIVFRTNSESEDRIPETTVTLLERVEVLAIGEETFVGTRAAAMRSGGRNSKVTVTLAVTPEQAGALKVVEGHGLMSLVVRAVDDEMLVGNVGPQTLAGLLDLPKPRKPVTTQIYRRGQLTTMVFEDGRQTEIVSNVVGLPVAAADRPRAAVHSVSQSVATNTAKDGAKGRGYEDGNQ